MTTSPLLTNQSSADESTFSNAENLAALYDRDYFAWIEATIKHLQQQDYSSVDWTNLIAEIADMSRSEKRRLRSNLRVVLMHLLKWQYQPERRSGGWKFSIVEHRIRIEENFECVA